VNARLFSLKLENETVCEVTAEYPLFFSLRPKLNKAWLLEVIASALRGYLLRRRVQDDCGVVKA
jgi:hypothetical protein